SSCAGLGGKAAREDLALVPREANFVLAANIAEFRAAPAWKKMVELLHESEGKDKYDEFVQKTGFNPETQLDSVFAGFPPSNGMNEFAIIARGGPFDEKRLAAYIK